MPHTECLKVNVAEFDRAALTDLNPALSPACRNSRRFNPAVRGPGKPQRSGGGLCKGGRGKGSTIRLVRGGCEGHSAEERL